MALNKQIKCTDGTLLSVQASPTHYSDFINNRWISFEIKTINCNEFAAFGDCTFADGDRLYCYVPRWKVEKFICEHGGILHGKIPEYVEFIDGTRHV